MIEFVFCRLQGGSVGSATGGYGVFLLRSSNVNWKSDSLIYRYFLLIHFVVVNQAPSQFPPRKGAKVFFRFEIVVE